MFWVVYNVVFAIGYTLMLPKFLARMWRRGGYRKDFLHRFGIYGRALRARLRSRRRVWIHAVSVGEMTVALRFVEEFRKADSSLAFVVSTTTSTGHGVAAGRVHPADVLIYFPMDFPWILRRAFGGLRWLVNGITSKALYRRDRSGDGVLGGRQAALPARRTARRVDEPLRAP